MEEITALKRRLDILHRADLILRRTVDADLMLQQFLELMMEAAQVGAGTLYLVESGQDELVFAVVRGPGGVVPALQGRRMPADQGIVGRCVRRGRPIWVGDVEHSPEWARDVAERSGYRPRNVLCLPLKVQGRTIGVVQLFDHPGDRPYTQAERHFLSVLVNDLALKMENARLLDSTRRMVARLQVLLEVGLELGTTPDRGRLLTLILDRVCQLLQAEAASVFEMEEESGELVLVATTSAQAGKIGAIRVPRGQGIAGWVAEHGETVLSSDVRRDPRFYARTDETTHFVTRSILCAPLVIQEQVPGQDGLFSRRIVGVAQALNKRGGEPFTPSDVEIFEGLARQAALAVERTHLYQEINNVIVSLSEALEAKDPYTRGHTRRVTAVSTAIAEEMGLSADEVGRVRTGALLHDIGKIGMPEAILQKPDLASDEERAAIRLHPQRGERILRPLSHLRGILPGVVEHHERYDGRGYPRGLAETQISLAGRIIAVADAFDAMTSDRPYRRALAAEAALGEIRAQAGAQFDPQVVAAFLSAWEKGRIAVPAGEPAPSPSP